MHEVVDIMQANIGKVMERGERLEDLQSKSGLIKTGMLGISLYG